MFSIQKKFVIQSPVAFAGAIFFALYQPAMVLASSQGYVPLGNRPRPQRTQGGGSRGCPNTQPVALQLLIPSNHTARTTLSHPTFAWQLSALPPLPLQFALTEEGASKPILVQELAVKHAGVMQFTLPSKAKGLEVGKEYRWTVSLICNAERPSENAYARGWVERITTDTTVLQQLAATKSTYQKAVTYAQAGIWYDSLAMLLNIPPHSADLVPSAEFLQTLLRQVGIPETIASKTP